MRKWVTALMLVFVAIGAKAQFESGTTYIGASLSGLGLSYSTSEKFRMGVDVESGYFVADCFMLKANVGYDHTRLTDDVRVGLAGRYYFEQNGIFLSAGAEFNHFTKSRNDLMIPVEIGYAFYLNHYLTIEPAVYYKMSLHDFSDNSTVGLRVGLGYYF